MMHSVKMTMNIEQSQFFCVPLEYPFTIGINNLVVGLLIVSVIKLMKDTKHPFVPNILNLCIKIKISFRFTNRSLFSAVPHVNI